MPLDPPLAVMLDMMARTAAPPMSAGTPAQAREAFDGLASLVGAMTPGGPRIAVGDVGDVVVAGAEGPLPARVYRPVGRDAAPGPLPTTVMFHGGGFVLGDLRSHDDQARLLCRGTGGVVVAVDYRLAPEHPYPAAPRDCEAATRHVLAHLGDFGGDPDRVGVTGDSAGANLAAVVAQRLRDEPAAAPLAAQLLWYPAVDLQDSGPRFPSRTENAEGYFLTADDMAWFEEQYLPAGRGAHEPGASPLMGDLAGLPPAVVATAQYDPLRDEGEAYAAALEAAGTQVWSRRYDTLIHGFLGMAPLSPACQTAADETIAAYAAMLG